MYVAGYVLRPLIGSKALETPPLKDFDCLLSRGERQANR